MKLLTKAVIINVSIIVGAIIMRMTGSDVVPVLLAVVVLLIVANVILVRKAKKVG